MKKNQFFGLAFLALGSCMFVSCMDDKYDLDNLDMTIGSKVDLWLPQSSTAPVQLASFMDLDEQDFVDTVFNKDVKDTIFYAKTSGFFELTMERIMDGEVVYSEYAPPIHVADVPEILEEEDVRLDLDNPVILANITSGAPSGGKLEADFEICSYKNDEEIAACLVQGLTVANPKSCSYVARKEEFIPSKLLDPQFGEPAFLELAPGQNFSDLILNVPDRLNTYARKLVASGFGKPVLTPTVVRVDLQIYAPLCIGPRFKIQYKSTEDGWAEDYGEDIEKAVADNLASITVEAKIDNDAPLDAEIEVVPIDVNGRDITDLPKLTTTVSAKSKDNPFQYTLKTREGSGRNLLDFISGKNNTPVIDGIRIVCTLKANQNYVGEYLRTRTSVRMKDVRLGIKGDISYDAN